MLCEPREVSNVLEELHERISVLEEQVQNLMEYISKTRLSSIYGATLQKEVNYNEEDPDTV